MTRRDWIVVLVLVVAFGWVTQLGGNRPLPPPSLPVLPVASALLAEDFSLPDLSGEPRTLADHAGEVVLLNFWASWCPPCREELPSLQRLHDSLGGEGLRVIAVSVDAGSSEAVSRFVERNGVTLPVLHDRGGGVARRYRVRAYPTSVVVDRAGRVVARVPSAWDWADPSAVDWLRQLLAE